MNANIDVRTDGERKQDMRRFLKKQRKERVKELGLPPKFAHLIMCLDTTTDECVKMYSNVYNAEKALGITGVRDAVLGLRENAGGFKWCYVFG